MVDRKKIEELVRNKLSQVKESSPFISHSPRDFINEDYVLSLVEGTKVIPVEAKALITPSARDLAARKEMEFQVVVGGVSSLPFESNPKSIALGSDHGGFPMKEDIKKQLKKAGYTVVDVGTNSTDSVDYPDFAHAVALMVARKNCACGIMVDGAGIGSAMVANKVPGVRAAHCHNIFEVRNAKEHNNANLLTLGGRVIGIGLAEEMVKVWLETPFAGGRHQKRVNKIMDVEKIYVKE